MSFQNQVTKLFKKELERCLTKLQDEGVIKRECDIKNLMLLCYNEEKEKAAKLKEKEEAKLLKQKQKEEAKALKLKAKEDAKAAKLKAKEEAKLLKQKQKEAEKAAKLKEKEEAKAAKLKAKEEAKAAKLKAKEEAKLLKQKEKEEKKALKLKEKEPLNTEEQVNVLVASELEEETDDETEVQKFSHESRPGETLWIDEENHVFTEEQDHIGNFDPESNTIIPVEE